MEKCCLKKTAGLVGGGFMAALFALVALALFSCSNMSGGGESSSKNSYPVVRFVANMQSDLAAAPQEISGLVSASAGDAASFNDGLSRSAIPEIAIDSEADAGVKYYVEAVTGTKGTDSYIRHFVYGNSSTLELGLESGKTWNVTCGIGEIEVAYAPNGNESAGVQNVYMSDNDPSVTISPDNPVYTKTFGLKPSTEGSGKVDLTFYVDSDVGIDGASCLVVECADLNIAADFTKAYGEEKIVFSTDSGKTIPSGSYEFVIKFLSSSGVLVYATSQTINVFDNMTTNSWSDDGSGAFKPKTVDGKEITAFVLDSDLVTKFVDNTIYVGDTGFGLDPDDNNAGTAFTPLAKLDAAFKRIAANGNRKDYRIYICGTLDEPNMIVPGSIDSTKAASITIEGYNGLDASRNPKDKILGRDFSLIDVAALRIVSSVPITTKNIWLAKKEGESGQSRGLYLQSGANMTLGPGTVISGFDAGRDYDGCSGGGVYVASGATLTVKGAVIKDNYAYEGGGLCVVGDGSVTMSIDGSQITGNHALYGGGISVKGAKVKITKTSISGNKADLNVNHDSGGGLSLDGGADVTLGNGVVVQGNTARSGGGVNMVGGTLTLDGGQIIQNKAELQKDGDTAGSGGGINLSEDSCNVYVYDGSISGNTADNLGGGIRFNGDWVDGDTSHSLYVTGGTIENNSAAKGGAIYIYPTNEHADAHFTFTLGGSASIPYGVDGAQGEGKNDIYFDGPNGEYYASIALQSALSKHGKTNPVAIRIADAGAKRGVPVVKAASPLTSLDACKDSFKLYSDDWNLKLSSDKKSLTLDSPIWVAGNDAQQCSGTPTSTGPGTKSHPYDSIKNACGAMTDSSVEYTILIDGTLTAKQYFNSCRAASISIEGANGLYPAGHEKAGEPMDAIDGSGIAYSQKDYMLYIVWAFDITIKNLKITGGDRSGNRNEGNIEGGGIFLGSGKTLTLSSGTLITKNKAGHGGGVYVQDSTLVIEDGAKITKNTATGGGAVYNFGGGVYLKKNNGKPVLKMAGGEISGNIASKGGGVGLYGASFFMYGNAIIGADLPEGQVGSSDTDKGCNTANCGGGIYLEGSDVYLGYEDANEDGSSPKTPHKLEKGVIGNYSYGTSTTATTYGGGGIYWSYNSNGRARIYMASGQIAKNAAEQKGGAIYYYSGSNTDSTLTIGGDASIPALDGAERMNDVYLLSPATLAGALTKHGASNPITITPDMYQSHGATVFKTAPERVLTSDDLKCFKLSAEKEDAGLALTLSSDCKSIKLDKPIYVKQGGTPSGSGTANGTKTKPYANIQAACGAMTSTSLDYTILVDGIDPSTGNSMPLLGAQTIPEDVTAKSITIRGANGLYPAGHEKAGEPKDALDGNKAAGKPVLTAKCSCPVILGNIKITGANNGANGGGVWRENGDLYIQEGTLITRNTANQGAGVFVSRCNLYMSGGQITSNESTISNGTYSGGICLTGNTSHNNGAFIYGKAVIGGVNKEHPACPTSTTTKDDVLNNGGNWCANQRGGGVGCFDANLYLGYKSAKSDGTPNEEAPWTGGIYGNYVGGEGGGVYVSGKMYMNSGEIAYNYTKSNGGGISNAGAFAMSGGTIANNYASGWGGAVYNYGDFTLTSNPCTAYIPYGINGSEGAGKNDVYHENNSTIKIDDGALLTMAPPIATVHFDTYSRGKPVLSGSESDLVSLCDHFALTSSDWLIGGEGKLVSALPLTVTYDLNITDTKAAPAASDFSLVDALFENTAENSAEIDEVDLFVTNVLKPSYDGFVGTGDKIFKFAGWDANNDGTADITIAPDATSFYYPDNFFDYVAATDHAITLKAVWTEDTSPSAGTLEAVYSNITYNTSYYSDHDEFRIYTAEQARQVFNNLSGKYFAERNGSGLLVEGTQKTITLMSDLEVDSLSPSCEIFHGILDGNGHTLTVNLGGNSTNGKYGLFYNINNGGVVKNLTIAGTIYAPSGTNEVGAICGCNSGTIDNCTVTATVKASGTGGNFAGVGGLVGRACGAVINCTFSGTVEGSGQRGVGGIVGYVQYGSITGNTIAASATIKYTGTDTSAGIGPIVGKGDASGNTVEDGATIVGGVLTANVIGY